MRSLLGRFHRPMSRGLVNNMLTMNNLGDGSTLNLDFTTMGDVLDPRLTFSRASTATFVNSSGYVEYAAHNLYYNTNFETITTGTSNPSLTGKGWGYALNQGTSFSATFNTNGSVTMSAQTGRIGLSRLAGFAGTGRRLIFSVDITSVGDTGLPPSQLVQEGVKTNETYYIDGTLWTSGNVVGPCTLSFVFTSNPAGNASTYFGIGMSSSSTAANITFANPRWGFYGGVNQLAYSPNTSATNANYLTAEYQAPRFDYSPTNIGQPRGLLVEGQTQNIIYYSQDVTQSGRWTVQGSPTSYTSISATGGTAPDNTNTANLCTESTTNVSRSIYQGLTAAAGTYTASVWVKAGTGSTRYIRLVLPSAAGNFVYMTVNISTGVVTQGPAIASGAVGVSAVSGTVTPYAGSWYRIQLTGTFAAAINFVFIVPLDSATPSVNTGDYGREAYLGNGSTFLMWGAQLEAGSGASSYIPTGASQVTRNRDTVIMSDISALNYTNAAGTLFADFTNNTENANFAGSIAFNNSSVYAQRFRLGVGSILVSYFQINGTTGLGSNLSGARTSFARAKSATSYSFDGTTTTTFMSINGAAASSTSSSSAAASVSIPTNLSLNSDNSAGATDFVSMTIRSIKYFPTAKSLVDMNGLTT